MLEIQKSIEDICRELYGIDMQIALTRPEPEFGDYATNVALQIAQQVGQNPREVAEAIAVKTRENSVKTVKSIEVAGPGFINLTLTDAALLEYLNQAPAANHAGKTVLVEYLDPNPFKELHIGHAYSGTIGDSIGNLFTTAGAAVHRVTYQGDVGLHVAKTLYAMQQQLAGQDIHTIPEAERGQWMGQAYAAGSNAYDEDEAARARIQEINQLVYSKADPALNELYEIGKAWSLEYFDAAYRAFGFTPFEKNYMEGSVAEEGAALVREHIADGVFTESDGAVVFAGEDHGLHTRVFINAQGLPTYEAKDLGNAMQKWRDYHYDQSVIITAEEQTQYFRVMLKALEQFAPEQANSTTHIAHGMVRLSSGKMSSRTGKVLRALDVLEAVEDAARENSAENAHDVALAAIKYAFLKNRIGGDVAFDINESVSLEGNSGPYLQYAHARARSILSKSPITDHQLPITNLEPAERDLVRRLGMWAEAVDKAVEDLMPHHICTYLYELSQQFNRFYEQNRVLGDPREQQRLVLVQRYADVLKIGLGLLGIQAPEHM